MESRIYKEMKKMGRLVMVYSLT